MKAKVRNTGEVVDVKPCSEPLNVRLAFYETAEGRKFPMYALEFEQTIDWEQRRYEIAKSALQGQLNNQYGDTIVGRCEFQHAAETSVKFADALIAELQKGGAE